MRSVIDGKFFVRPFFSRYLLLDELQLRRRGKRAFLAPDEEFRCGAFLAGEACRRGVVRIHVHARRGARVVDVGEAGDVLLAAVREHVELARLGLAYAHEARSVYDQARRVEEVRERHVLLRAVVRLPAGLVDHVVDHERGVVAVVLHHAEELLSADLVGDGLVDVRHVLVLVAVGAEPAWLLVVHHAHLVSGVENRLVPAAAVAVEHVHAELHGRRHVPAREFRRGEHAVRRPEAPADPREDENAPPVEPELRVRAHALRLQEAEAEPHDVPVHERALLVLQRNLHVVEMGIVYLPELRLLDDGVEVERPRRAGGHVDRADLLREDRLRVLHGRGTGPVLDDRRLHREAGRARASVHEVDGRVDVAERRLVAHEHVLDADRIRDDEVDAAGDAAKAVRKREHVLPPFREGVVAPAEVAVRVRDAHGEFVRAAVVHDVAHVDLERRLQHELVADELPVDEHLRAVADAFAEREDHAAALRGGRHVERASPPAHALVVARLPRALAVSGDRVEEIALDRAGNGHLKRQLGVLPRRLGLGPRNGFREKPVPSAPRTRDRQRAHVDRRQPVPGVRADLRRVRRVEVELIGLVFGLFVEPQFPPVPAERSFNACAAERAGRRERGNSHHANVHVSPFH